MALGPWAYWPLDETSGTTLHDVSGNNRHASFSAGVNHLGVSGLVPTSSDAAINTVSANNAANGLPFTMTRITFLAWFSTLQGDSDICIFEVNAGGGIIFAQLRLENGKAYFQMDDNVPNVYFAQGAVDLRDGRSHFIAGVYDGAAIIVYVDGAPVASSPAVFTPRTGTRDCGLGYIPNFISGQHFNGVLDEMVIYDYALTAAAIAGLYAKATTI